MLEIMDHVLQIGAPSIMEGRWLDREFDSVKVLKAAGAVFWAKGFKATTTRELTDCTGLTQSSIYAAFGHK
jgi:tetracycline repressor-like protein